MEFLKQLFAEGALTYDEFVAAVQKAKDDKGEASIKLANLATGDYVAKAKYDAEVTRAKGLQDQITQRDNDITALKNSVKDNETLTATITTLQGNYADLEAKSKKQAREHEIQLKLMDQGVKPKFIKSVMSEIDDAKLGEDFSGLEAEITRVKGSFEEFFGETVPDGTGADGFKPSEKTPDTSKMSDDQYYAWLETQKK